jgi:hypothetical protein
MISRILNAVAARARTALGGRRVFGLAPLVGGLAIGALLVAMVEPAPRHVARAVDPVANEPAPGIDADTPPVIRFAAIPRPEPRARPSPERVPAWRAHAAAAPPTEGRPMIAVIIDDMGLDRRRSRLAAALPAPLTLAYLPYARDLGSQTRAARARGHELLVHVPMEGIAPAGINTLRTAHGPDELLRRLDWSLGRFEGYVGINNHMGSRFTADPKLLGVILGALQRRGLLFVDSRTTSDSVAPSLARSAGIAFAVRDVFLDHDQRADAVAASLAELERIARARGHAVAIGHPHETTIEALGAWIPEAQARGFVLVPVSAVVGRGGSQARHPLP